MAATQPIYREPVTGDARRAQTLLALHSRLGTASGRTMIRPQNRFSGLGKVLAGTSAAGSLRVRGGAV